MDKEVKALIKGLEKRGYYVTRNKGHYKLRSPDGNYLVSLPASPGRGRWKQNLISILRKEGLI